MTANHDPLPPHSAEAERGLLGSILIDPLALHKVTPILAGCTDFYDQRHQWIYKAMVDLTKGGVQPDTLAVWDVLERRKQDIQSSYLTGLVSETPTSMHAEHYARIVADYGQRRRLIGAATAMTKAAYDVRHANPVALAHKQLMGLDRDTGSGLVAVPAAIGDLYDQIEAWSQHPLGFGEVRGLATHIKSLDHLLGGMERGTLLMLAGRPSMGKSALALEVGRLVAMTGGATVAIFELEMTKQAILMRWGSAMSEVESRKVKRGVCPDKYRDKPAASYFVSDEEMARYMHAMAELSMCKNLLIDDTPALTAQQIRARCLHKAHELGRLDLVIVDHTTIMGDDSNYRGNTAKAEGAKSQQLKDLAKELDCPVLLVQQLSRATEGRSDRRPTLADLRDSGEHEQNADVVLGLYRESYYKNNVIPGSEIDLDLEVLGLKSREGPTAKIRLRYERHLHRFTEWKERK